MNIELDKPKSIPISLLNSLDSKNCDFEEVDFDNFHYMWVLDNDMIFSIEYIPCNYPSLTCMCLSTETYLENIRDVDWIMRGRTIQKIKKIINDKRVLLEKLKERKK